MTGPRLVLATRNAHKVVELRELLADLADADALVDLGAAVVGVDAFPDVPDVVESEVTFEGNALLKARAVAAATGLPALADDSGLAVDVLGGSPGIFSARWSGRHGDDRANVELLLAQTADVPVEHLGAQFVCAAALVLADGTEHVERGVLRGTLDRHPRGEHGFGYDPVFRPEGDAERTLAQYAGPDKHAISHRGRAMRAIAPRLLPLLAR